MPNHGLLYTHEVSFCAAFTDFNKHRSIYDVPMTPNIVLGPWDDQKKKKNTVNMIVFKWRAMRTDVLC